MACSPAKHQALEIGPNFHPRNFWANREDTKAIHAHFCPNIHPIYQLEQGLAWPRLYDWARVRVIESYDDLPGPELWLLALRSISTPKEITYYFAFAPLAVPMSTLALVAATRYTVEQCRQASQR